MDIRDLRKQIDSVDHQLCELFKERMDIITKVAEYKHQNALPVNNSLREREVLANVSKLLGSELEVYGRTLYRSIFDLSKSYETKLMGVKTPLYETLSKLVNAKPVAFPKRATVACQGCEGAYSQMAAEHLFEV